MSTGPAPTAGPEPADTPSDRLPASGGDVGVPRTAVGGLAIAASVLVVLGVATIGAVVGAIVDPDFAEQQGSVGGVITSQAFFAFGLIATALGATAVTNRTSVTDSLRRLGVRRFGPRVLLTLLIAIFAYIVLSLVISAILSPEQEDIAENFGANRDASIAVTVLAGFLIVPVAAFAEELFFRGLVFGGLRQSMPLWIAAAISGALFGLGHLTTGDVAVALQLSIFGAILAWTYERDGSLWAPMTLHLLNNALAFTLLITDTI